MLSGNSTKGTHASQNRYRIVTPLRQVRGEACMNVSRNLFAYSAGILVALLLVAFFTPSAAYGSDAVDSYIASVSQLLQRHRSALPRLIAPANETATALIRGGAFYLGGYQGWVDEGLGRAGGLMMVRPLSRSKSVSKGDVVWLAYTPSTYSEVQQQAKELESQGCLVIAFGPKLASGAPQFTHWIDSLTPPTADNADTEMGNVLSLWTLTGEVAASVSRQGKTLVFWQSIDIWGSGIRNKMYQGMAFHDGFPKMFPTPPGVLSEDYIAYVQNMLQNIREWELPKIISVGKEMARRAAEGQPALLTAMSHMMPFVIDQNSKLFRYIPIPQKQDEVGSQLHQGDFFVFIGYVGVYLDVLRQVRMAGATAAWIIAPLHTGVHLARYGDVMISQHWHAGDCAVEAPGYDVRILPPSGIAQLFIYEIMLRAAGTH